MKKTRVLFSWSGGKDSAMALHELLKDKSVEVVALLTTVSEEYDRSSMHGVRRRLMELQAAAMGFPLEVVLIPSSTSMESYEQRMRVVLERHKAAGTDAVAIGDIFLEDLRKYREQKLAQIGMQAIFPIWRRDTRELAQTFIDLGFKAIITCVDTHVLDRSFSGRLFDRQLLSDLPAGVDPCGENGEFHTFVFDGPLFSKPLAFTKGEVVLRENRFCFCDLIPSEKKPKGACCK